MPSITDLKDAINTKTASFIFLSLVTAGIYPILWIHQNTEKMEKITGKTISIRNYAVNIAGCVGMSNILAALASLRGSETMPAMSSLLILLSGALYIVWAFKAKSAMEEYVLTEYKIDLKMNVFYTFVLNIYYINYCANHLPEIQRKQQILTSKTNP